MNQKNEQAQGSELSNGLSAFGNAGATCEKPKFYSGVGKVKFRSEPKNIVVSLPMSIWHQVEIFEDGTERHSIEHPLHGIFIGKTLSEALHNATTSTVASNNIDKNNEDWVRMINS